jgi:hypothetical protein
MLDGPLQREEVQPGADRPANHRTRLSQWHDMSFLHRLALCRPSNSRGHHGKRCARCGLAFTSKVIRCVTTPASRWPSH